MVVNNDVLTMGINNEGLDMREYDKMLAGDGVDG